jgi:hypothetical protein
MATISLTHASGLANDGCLHFLRAERFIFGNWIDEREVQVVSVAWHQKFIEV